MKYWILSLPRGDKVACYVTKEYKIIAPGEVTQPLFEAH